ncbi:acylneuraminate cytidylyltransferase family protein [Prochlorococcus marinus]|jgi:CMP-N-acetylneuraminic acid synthetase|uniref:CMP-N-acetylneuraminic acid synthetase n=1 Tax=Prochlorococcus marinus (strain MIT 9301) TaxID=167546 RepID=A3PE61_PROM0|nr:acylneuraminate cytidylyltransferase family protein [Prochlorococcus marinus]ABO18036.1 CMP-N-acetylneuraminic acid synthetase [Prochlorococcus marinus str. MIT 9301]
MSKDFYAFIFARGGSKGITKKNLRKINGISLVRRSIDLALQLDNVLKIFLSTDSQEIANEVNSLDVEVIKRPYELAKDETSEILAWKHAINVVEEKFGSFDKFVSIPPTSPLRSLEDVKNIMFLLNAKFDLTLGITKSKRNPWFNMVKKSEGNQVTKIFNDKSFSRRQDAPLTFDLTTVAYAAHTSYVINSKNLLDGVIGGLEIPEERSLDIDTEIDLKMAEFFLNQ